MEKKRTLYEITGDLQALHSLMESLVDENGEPREPTEAELETMKGWFKADKEAILQDLKDGILTIGTEPLMQTRLFFKDGKRLPFVNVHQPTALVIR